jgi:serine/threonine protein kinase
MRSIAHQGVWKMADLIGQQLGNYRIIGLIGRGGFADAYLGEHIYLKTQVAIKVLRTRVANNEDLEGFLKEARTIAHLVHPHIVRVMDFGVEGETPFLVMDYAPNGTLRQRHPKGTTLPLTTITSYVKQTATALQYAHDEKLIHRDVKPENMLLGRKNDVLLSDFGIALVAQSSRYQNTQDVVGTVAYMSPEQIQGKPRPASDQYSLGIVVYEWLSGDRPFHGSFTELCTQHMFASPPPLREKVPTIPPDIEHVVTTALAKDPKQRFGSVQAFANALEQASQAQLPTILAPQPNPQTSSFPPTQAAIIPPMPQTQVAMAAPISQTGGDQVSVDRSTSEAKQTDQIPDANHIDQASSDEKVKLWSIGKRQIVAMVIGTALYAGLSHLFISIIPSFTDLIAIFPALIIPLFFGAVFGPWAGLFTGGIGFLIGEFFTSITNNWYVPLGDNSIQYFSNNTGNIDWYWTLSIALIGFVAGLTRLLIIRRRYTTFRSIILTDIISALGVFVCFGFANLSLSWNAYLDLATASSYILKIALPGSIFCLILFPILLFIYISIARSRKRA